MRFIKFLALGMTLFFVQNNFSQNIIRSNISSFGSQFSDGNISISQTVGQSSNTNIAKSEKVIFRQGFQQPLKASSNLNNDNLILNYSLYPSPNNGFFTINIEMLKNEAFEFEIINILGSKLYKDIAYSQVKKDINVSHLPGGVYILRIIENNYSLGEIKFVIY